MPASASFAMDHPGAVGRRFAETCSTSSSGVSTGSSYSDYNDSTPKTFTDLSQSRVSPYEDLTNFDLTTGGQASERNLSGGGSTEGLNVEEEYYYKSEDPYKDLIEMIEVETKKELEEVSEYDSFLEQVKQKLDKEELEGRQRAERLKEQLERILQTPKEPTQPAKQDPESTKKTENGLQVNQPFMPEVFICFACGRAFLDELKMREHINQDHLNSKDYPYKCSQCYKKFQNKAHLVRHQKTHNKEHVCALCNMAFTSFESYIIHKGRVHNLSVSDKPIQEKIECEKCGIKKDTEAELNRHKYWCYNAEKIKKNRQEAKIRVSVSAPSSTNVSPAGGGPIRAKLDKRCEYCNQEFASMQSKIRHFHRKHPEKVEEATRRTYAPMVSPNLQFMCNECHRSFATSFALKTHQKRHQVDSHQFSCEQCGRSYVLPSELRKHIKRVHEKSNEKTPDSALTSPSSSTEVSPAQPKRERRGRPPISAQMFINSPKTNPTHASAVISPGMESLTRRMERMPADDSTNGEQSMEVESEALYGDLSKEPIEDMPDFGDL